MSHLVQLAAGEAEDLAIDTFHGVTVPDPFRWLEDSSSSRTREWTDRQAEVCRAYLNALPGVDDLRSLAMEQLDSETVVDILKCQDTIFSLKREIGREQARVYRRVGLAGNDREIVNPDSLGEGHSLSLLEVSSDCRLIALGLRAGGHGARRILICDAETGVVVEESSKGAVRGFGFLPDGESYLYSLEAIGPEGQVRDERPMTTNIHKIGEPFASDKVLFRTESARNIRLVSAFDRESSLAIHTVIRSDGERNLTGVHLQQLSGTDPVVATVIENGSDLWDVRIHGNQLFLGQHSNTAQRILRVPLSQPSASNAQVVLQEESGRINTWHLFGSALVVASVIDIASCLSVYTLEGVPVRTITLPEPGTVLILGGDGEGFFFGFESYGRSREIYYHDLLTGETTLFSTPSPRAGDLVSLRLQYSGDDQKLIPITLVGNRQAMGHGNSPIFLTAYGASGASVTPQYSPLVTVLMRLGVVFAIAHVRGGGELGTAWAEAGKRRCRATVHKDFLAARDFLVTSGIADAERIAIAGGSSSGLLVCTAITQSPDSFRAALCVAPLTDMLRYHRFRNTQFYIPEFGTAEDPKDFPVLLGLSPYHNVRPGVRYPALLMVSGKADTRCDPMHARKLVARLQAAMSELSDADREQRPILLDWNPLRGHAPALPLTVRANAIADRLAFLCHHLGIEVIKEPV